MAPSARVPPVGRAEVSLDLRHQQSLLRLVRAFVGPGSGAVVVLHNINLPASYCDRVAVMNGGTIVAAGHPGTVLSEEMLAEVYGVRLQRVQRSRSDRPAFLVETEDPSGTAA